jgi:hypothetical protein
MVLRRFNDSIIYNRRYIDDGLLLINDDKQIPLLQTALNEYSNLNLTWQNTTTHGIYLDSEIYEGIRLYETGVLDLQVYTKPISKFLYLNGKSCHPPFIFTGIIKGEMILFLRNTSNEKVWLRKITFLFTMLNQRGYTARWLRQARQFVTFTDRDRYLKPRIPVDRPQHIAFTIPYPQAKIVWRLAHEPKLCGI